MNFSETIADIFLTMMLVDAVNSFQVNEGM